MATITKTLYDTDFEAVEAALLETGLAGGSADLGIPDRCPVTVAEF